MSTDKLHWQFNSPVAELRCESLMARVDVSTPQRGMHALAVGATKIDGQLLATEWISDNSAKNPPNSAASAAWPIAVSDAYVRGSDLVATYGRYPNSHYAPQIYWRIEQGAGSIEHGEMLSGTPCSLLPAPCCLSLLVSVQTDLLDSNPRIRVTTTLAADDAMRVDAPGLACVLWRIAGCDVSYVEIVAESDFQDINVVCNADDTYRAQWELFAEFLEKGVIRRAQIQGAFLPREHDVELAAEWCRATQRRPLPLTT